MIVKCTKTGKILATDEEIREHSDAFGVCSFEEIEPDSTKLWMNTQTGKYCFSKNELDMFLHRSGDSPGDFAEVTVTEFLKTRSLKQQQRRNDVKIEQFANDKFLNALVEIKGYAVVPSEKALWFTKNASVASAEEWLKAHVDDSDFNCPLKLLSPVDDEPVPSSSVAKMTNLEQYVDQSVVAELLAMGFPRDRVIRSVWKTANGGTASAVEWLTQHSEDVDEPLPTEIPVPDPIRAKLSTEEAQIAALELQRKLREERIVREANEAKDKERLRIVQTKQMMEHQAQIEESNRLRDIAQREQEKRLAEQHKAELTEKIRLDFIDRFGYEPPAVEKAKPAKDQILTKLNFIRKSYSPVLVEPCLSALRLYLNNIASNSSDKKFHKIKCNNKMYEKITPISEAVEILLICGFQKNTDFLEIPKDIADGFLCAQAVKYIDVVLGSLWFGIFATM